MRSSAIQPESIANPRLEVGATQLPRNASTPLPERCPDRTFESSLPVSRGQPRDAYRMNERTGQIGPPHLIACGRPAYPCTSTHWATPALTDTSSPTTSPLPCPQNDLWNSYTSTRVPERRSGQASHRKRTRHHNAPSRQSTHWATHACRWGDRRASRQAVVGNCEKKCSAFKTRPHQKTRAPDGSRRCRQPPSPVHVLFTSG